MLWLNLNYEETFIFEQLCNNQRIKMQLPGLESFQSAGFIIFSE